MIEDRTDESKTKILRDPWFDGEEYLGSLAIYSPYEFVLENFSDVDYIYISHIHPDYSSAKTLSQLNKNIPVLIHNFPKKFLKQKKDRLPI